MVALRDVIDVISFDNSRKVTVTFLGGAHNVKFSDKGVAEQEYSFFVELAGGDKPVTLNDGTVVVQTVETLRRGLVGDSAERQTKLDTLLQRDDRYREGMLAIEAEVEQDEDV